MTDESRTRAAGSAPAGDPAAQSWPAALLRLWRLARDAAMPARNAAVAVAALWALWLALWIAIDRGERLPSPQFTPDGIPLLAWYALGILALAGLLRRFARPAPTFRAALVLSTGLVPVPLLLVTVAADHAGARQYELAAVAAMLYGAVYLARGLRPLTGRPQPATAAVGVLFVAAFVWASDRLDVIPDLWNPLEAQQSPSAAGSPDAEALLFEQPDRIDEQLAALRSGPPGVPQAYFVGFAGVGAQRVFTQEIGLAKQVLGARYGMEDRSLTLLNDERDFDTAPLATVSGLRYALRALGARMHTDRDVLFLAISSHGAPDGAIAVANADLPLDDLTTEDLADALRESGIEWRVIIISACYAGAFVEPLRDPRTIVIAAAAADRTSFGCSNDSELTYFGEAFYRDALPGARSLRDAFRQASRAIAARERHERFTPSDPQAYFGAAIETKIAAMKAAQPASAPRTIVRAGRAD